ncbi:TetR family transcriptional regulator [Mycobacteroides chelonae]|uniref:TetR/AcrR family transcriptional regulator n=1 Tax=Mycobacteroides TaxID=670516 RepID=UPI0007DAE11A|nr:TetR/AcrR family transcriptional regulator [Mycobacteroides chelonae]PKQ57286.1 TetR family transcriptional regulator [Mycobacterium sp. MHSD3]AYM42934.1 TetR/AcrR family transcriptional regulator [[Mycobacterium] chelonae subsp. gwanakae]MBF9522337.1 TetR/AcrR family transcriptional regulator [Mycobacteroides chelonae]OHT81047.1 TetR family transcriptional regulator [Mycobacteroides chelonae]OHU09311.1 TetR family transcriptional regulator [Mycobacteroides chelonae]
MDLGAMWTQWSSGQAAPEDQERERLLDAARAEFVAHGFRRAAVADIAKRAKVSRQTLNRRCGDKDDMVSAVVGREVLQFFLTLAPLLDPGDKVEDQVVEVFVTGMRECRVNPVVAALKEYEAESMSMRLFETEHGNYQLALSVLVMRLMGDGYPEEGAKQAAELIMRITATLLLAPSKVLRADTDEEARNLAVTYFLPVLAAARVVTD